MNYIPQHPSQSYVEFIRACADFFHLYAASSQSGKKYCLFTIGSQHVYGDSLPECLDLAMDIVGYGQQGWIDRCNQPVARI
jgi:hypothetical protein